MLPIRSVISVSHSKICFWIITIWGERNVLCCICMYDISYFLVVSWWGHYGLIQCKITYTHYCQESTIGRIILVLCSYNTMKWVRRKTSNVSICYICISYLSWIQETSCASIQFKHSISRIGKNQILRIWGNLQWFGFNWGTRKIRRPNNLAFNIQFC